MKNRRGFLTLMTAVSGAALGAGMSRSVRAQTVPKAVTPAPAPAATPVKAPSAASLAIAATFRAFDARLSDEELHAIATGIDENRTGPALNPRKKPLRNSDEMVARFAAAESF